ncbi:hypothetical protein SAMN05660690_1777 [Geodermatophilus telluris]|uniref:Uncharacterized protein n=1 Tax=Geodermatophilus telluris TaxID=1190417 RepID=A0A1G6MBC4_9ACTN|nr:hypothetical protein SAMN05660690_1777 [Geodermatophilus telluris]
MGTGQQAGVGSVETADEAPHGQEQVRRLLRVRCAAEQLATARLLERCADSAATPALAVLLRERAGERRRRGERLLAGPPEAGPVPARRAAANT